MKNLVIHKEIFIENNQIISYKSLITKNKSPFSDKSNPGVFQGTQSLGSVLNGRLCSIFGRKVDFFICSN